MGPATTDLVRVTYASNYSEASLRAWADKVQRWMNEGRDVHADFDHDAFGYAPSNAARLVALLHRVEALLRICLSSAGLRVALRRRSGVDWRRRSAEHLRSCSRNRCWAGLHHEDSIAVTPATA
jgi:hypothetical protein